jgi:hypothetical protein
MPNLSFKPDDISSEVWMGVGGVMLVLLRSIVDGTRRTALQLLVGCVFGGLGAMAAGFVWGQSHYVYLICGVAAVVTENLVIGLFNMSNQFAQNPKDIIAWFIQTVLPSLGMLKGLGGAAAPSVPSAPVPPAPAAPTSPVAPPAGPVVQSGEPNG